MDDEGKTDGPPATSRAARVVERGCFYASMIGFVLMVGLVLLYLLIIAALSGCASSGC